jgi:hypothetical protein
MRLFWDLLVDEGRTHETGANESALSNADARLAIQMFRYSVRK